MKQRKRSLFQEFASYVSFNVLGMIGISCYILADTFFVANGVGADGLAGLNLVLPVYSLLHGISMMLGMGGATRFNLLATQRRLDQANGVFTLTLLVGGIIGLLFTLTGIFLSGPITSLLGAKGQIQPLASTYLQTLLYYSAAFMMNNILQCFVRNDGNPRLSMTAMLVGSLTNIVLDYVFIFLFDWGMFGAAFATGIAPVIGIAILSLHSRDESRNMRFVKPLLQLRQLGRLCAIGTSPLIIEVSSGLVMLLFNLTILELVGNVGVAAYGVIANLALVITAIFNGASNGAQPLISRYFGTQQHQKVQKVFLWAAVFSLSVSVLLCGLSFLFDQSVASLFNKDNSAALTQLVVDGIHLYFPGFILMSFNILCAAFFAAVNAPKQSIAISLLRGILLIVPLIYCLSAWLGMTGVWLVVPTTELLTLTVSLSLAWRYRKRLRDQ